MKKIQLLVFFISFQFFYAQAPNDKQAIDFTSISTELEFDVVTKTVTGKAKATFIAKENSEKAYLDAQTYKNVTSLDSLKVNYKNNKIWLVGNFKKGNTYTYNFKYKTQPKKALYFWGWY